MDETQTRYTRIDDVAVHPDHQGRGLGRSNPDRGIRSGILRPEP